jgi:hypothetical protein
MSWRPGRWWFGVSLLVVGLIIFGLRKLATWPYRPPYDMSTFLGGPELAFVEELIMFFAVVWCALLFGFIVSLLPLRPAD